MSEQVTCPECGAGLIRREDGVFTVGKPRLHNVPSLILLETACLAEKLRVLADQLERGDKGGPTVGIVVLLEGNRLLLHPLSDVDVPTGMNMMAAAYHDLDTHRKLKRAAGAAF